MNLNNSKNRYILKVILLLNIICFAPFISHAQEKLVIHGKIINQVTGIPIYGVNVRLQNTLTGTSTNVDGHFELMTNRLPAVLVITHISYFGKQIIVNQVNADSLIILLNPKTVTLDETEITASTYQVFNEIDQEVIDYDFLDSNLIILSYNFNKNLYELIFSDENLHTICINDISYLKKPEQLFKDCMGNCHLLTSDSAYQLYSANQSIYLIYPTPLQKFLQLLGGCLFETPTHLAFKGNEDKTPKLEYAARNTHDLPAKRSKNEQWKHLFYFVNKKTHEKFIFDNVYEWEKNRDAYEHAMFIYLHSDPDKRDFGETLRFEEMTYFKPAFQSLQILNDTIYYFNHLKSQIDVYSVDLILLNSIHIEYPNQKNWKPIIIVDDEKNKAYTIFKQGAIYSLAEINLKDGLLKEVAKIDKLFPQKIKVNNGQLYFLYNDVNNVWGRRQLYKGELPSY